MALTGLQVPDHRDQALRHAHVDRQIPVGRDLEVMVKPRQQRLAEAGAGDVGVARADDEPTGTNPDRLLHRFEVKRH